MIEVSREFIKYLYNFNYTLFNIDLQRKTFVYNIIYSGESLISAIYGNSSFDINFASELIKTGVTFFPNKLLFGLYTQNATILKKHVKDINGNISSDDYQISHEIINAMYSDQHVKYYNSFNCFYPPAIIANFTNTNSPAHKEKIFKIYEDLYNNSTNVIKDVLDIAAIVSLYSANVSFIAPVIDNEANAFKHALYLNGSTHNQHSASCLLPFGNFDDLEIGRLLHELAHLATDYIFQNYANPYSFHNNSQKQEYNYIAKQFISNITSFLNVPFPKDAIEENNITILNFKYALIGHKDILKDIMLYSSIYRIDEHRIINHIFRELFTNLSISTESATKYIKALYKAEMITKNISTGEAIALERISDWLIYPDQELDKELIARFVELNYRFKESNHSQDSLKSMMTYWQDNVSPMVVELKESLNLEECCILDNEFDYNGYIALGAGIVASTALIILTCSGSLPFPYHLLIGIPE